MYGKRRGTHGHIHECLPEICTLDCGTMNFAEADYVMTNTPGMLRAIGGMLTALGVRPEIEAFDTGHLWLARQLVADGVLESPTLVQLCMGVPWRAPDDLNTFMAMVNNVPANWIWSAFSIGRHQVLATGELLLNPCQPSTRRACEPASFIGEAMTRLADAHRGLSGLGE